MKIILISGKAGSGKDTVAEILKEHLISDGVSESKILVTHFADLLKYIATKFFGWNGVKDDAGRTLLQHLGTNVVREKNPNYWTDFIKSVLKLFENEWEYVFIPDTRFPNEVSEIVSNFKDVKVVRVNRPRNNILSEAQQEHPSETALDDFKFDVVLENSFETLDELSQYLREMECKIYG